MERKNALMRAAVSAIALACLFAYPACSKKQSRPDASEGALIEAGDSGEPDGAAEGFGASGSDFVIRAGAGFYELDGSEMKWKDGLSLGQAVEARGAPVKGTYQKTEFTLVPVKLESGKEGYVIDSQLAVDATMGVVVSDLATVYKQAKETAVGAKIVPPRNIVAVWPVQGSPDFYRLLAYDMNTGERYADQFLASSDVSVDSDDVNVALLLLAIKGVARKEQKMKLLSTIVSKYPASAFSGIVQEIQIALEPEKMGTVALGSDYRAVEDGAVLDIPSEFGGIVKKFTKGEIFTAEEATTEQFKLGEESAPWIRVSAPAEGWVFGAALEERRD